MGSDRGDAAAVDRHVALDHLESIVHREDDAVANEQRGGRAGSARYALKLFHRMDSSAASRLAILPCLTATSSARMLTAISCGVTAPMSSPIGAWMRDSVSRGMPSAVSASYMRATFARLPMRPRYRSSRGAS